MAFSLMKPPNASNSNLANAGKNLNAYRLVKFNFYYDYPK